MSELLDEVHEFLLCMDKTEYADALFAVRAELSESRRLLDEAGKQEPAESIIAAYKSGVRHGAEQPDHEFEFASGSASDKSYAIGYNEGYEQRLASPVPAQPAVMANSVPPDGVVLDALKRAREDINWMLNEEKFLAPFVFDYIDAALLAASKEDGT